jgi:hypothetical protein
VLLAAALASALCAARAVTFPMSTSDVWQHLLVGKALWALGRVPHEHLWTWPMFGTPDVLPSWGFRALLWPFWQAGGEWGLQVWRWLTTLAAFALGWATARRLGARGVIPLVVIAVAAMSYRARGQVRPETMVAVLLALQVWVLERRRAPRGERGAGAGALALILIAWGWANVHISYYLGLAITGFHLLARPAAGEPPDPGAAAAPRRSLLARIDRMPLGLALAACAAISFANPFGWRALWQPVEYFLYWRHQGVFLPIPELAPLLQTWPSHLRSGLPFLVVLWPLLAIGRAFARRLDVPELLTCALFTGHALFNQRFTGSLAIVMVPYLSRDLSDLAGRLRAPAAWTRSPARATIAVAAMVLASLPGWADPRFPLGIGFVATAYPTAACDFIESHGLGGRMFNPFYFGGYVMWRFWPQRDLLPFMDIHQSGTPADRELYARVFASPDAWNELMREHHFEMALLDGHQEWVRNDRLLDVLDADRSWALVFRDDAAALYLRRGGSMAVAAETLAYKLMPGGNDRISQLGEAVARDTMLRRILRIELERSAASSPLNSRAHSNLANLDFLDGDRAGARRNLDAALAVDPRCFGAHRRIGYLWMAEEQWPQAIDEFQKEIATGGPAVDEYQRIAECWEKMGDRARAVKWYRRELDKHAANDQAREALGRLGAGP